MSIVNFKKTGVIPRINPNANSVSEYSSRVDRLSQISMNLSGTPWKGDYIHQILAENEDAKHLDVNLSPVNQSYSMISDMELFVTSPLDSSVDADTGVATVSGTANVYGFLKPAIGDMFLTSLIEGGTGLLAIVEVQTSGYNSKVHYEVTYNLMAILEEDPVKFEDLRSKIKVHYVFDKSLIATGNVPIITAEQSKDRTELATLLNITLKDYVRDFLDIDTKTFLVPTEGPERIYDDYLVEFVKHIIDRAGVVTPYGFMRYTVDDRSASVTSIWTVLMDRAYLHTDVIAHIIGVEPRYSYTGNKVGSSMRYAPLDYIAKLDTDNKNASWVHMHTLLGVDTDGHVALPGAGDGSDGDHDHGTDGGSGADGGAGGTVPAIPGAPIITTPDTPDTIDIPWVNPNPVVETQVEIWVDGKIVAAPSGASSFKESEVYQQLKTWIRPDGTVVDTVESMNRVGDSIYIFTSSHKYHSGDGIDLTNLGIEHQAEETLPNGDVVVTYFGKDNNIIRKETTSDNGVEGPNHEITTTTTGPDGETLGSTLVGGVEPNIITLKFDANGVEIARVEVAINPFTQERTTYSTTSYNGVLQTEEEIITDPNYVRISYMESHVLNEGDDLEDDDTPKKTTTVITGGDTTVIEKAADGTVTETITNDTGYERVIVRDADNAVVGTTTTTESDGIRTTTEINGNVETVTVVEDDVTVTTETTTSSDGSTRIVVTEDNLTTTTTKDPNGDTLTIQTVKPLGENTETRSDNIVTSESSVTVTNADGEVLSIVQVLANGDTVVTDENGDTVESVKDADGDVITSKHVQTSDDGTVTTTVYDATGTQVSKTIAFEDASGVTTTTVITGAMRYTIVSDADGNRVSKTALTTVSPTEKVKTTYGPTDADIISTEDITTVGSKVTSVRTENDVVTTVVEEAGDLVSTSVLTTDEFDVTTETITGPEGEAIVTIETDGAIATKTYPNKLVIVTTYPVGNVREVIRMNDSLESVEYYRNADGDLIETVNRTYDNNGVVRVQLGTTAQTGARQYIERDADGNQIVQKTYEETATKKIIESMDPSNGQTLYTVTAYRESYSSIHIEAIDDGGAKIPVTEGMLAPFADLMASEMSAALAEEEVERGGIDLITVVQDPNPDDYTIVGGITNTGTDQ